MKGYLRDWKVFAYSVALVATLGTLTGCPTGPTTVTLTGPITAVDTEAQTITVAAESGEVTVGFADASIFLPEDEETATGTTADLVVDANVTIVAPISTDGTVDATTITIAESTGGGGGGGGGTNTNIGEGSLIIPRNELALEVNGGPLSRNGDLSKGSIDWYSFEATGGTKYNILTRGNAPVVVSVYKAVQIGRDTAASMLWTTDPTENIQVLFVENPAAKTLASAEAQWIPSFVAPSDGDYFVSVQAAIVTVCAECGATITEEGHIETGDPHVITYHDVRSYSVEVSTVSDASTATPILAADPKTDPAFLLGAVTISQGDWFYFDGEADTNYMIEFRPTNQVSSDSVYAKVYAPSGSIACESIACTECKATPFYSPVAARYLINVTRQGNWQDDSVEWGQADYMIRILNDDHGNSASLATTIALSEEAAGTASSAGYLSSTDDDIFMFEMQPFRTYRVATSSNAEAPIKVDVALEDLGLSGNGPWNRDNVDGIGNESALFQNSTGWPEYAVAGVSPAVNNDAFGLRMGEFNITVFNDDHADDGAQLFDATTLTIGTQSTGVLWGDVMRDNDPLNAPAFADVNDTDLFAFTPVVAPIWHRVNLTGATSMTIAGQAPAEDDETTKAVESQDHYVSTGTADPVRILVEGPNAHQLGTPFTLNVTQEDHANLSGNADTNEGNAAVLAAGVNTAGILWGEPGDDDIFQFEATPNFTYKVSVTGATGNTTLGGTQNVVANYTLEENDRAVSVRHGGADPVANIVQVALGAATDDDFGYNVKFEADDHIDTILDPNDDDEVAAISEITGTATAAVLFKSDTDLFKFTAQPNRSYKVQVTGASGETTLTASDLVATYPNVVDSNNRAVVVRHLDPEAKTVFVAVSGNNSDADVTYSVSVVNDDEVDVQAAGTTLNPLTLGIVSSSRTLFVSDTDLFAFTTVAATNYTVTLSLAGDALPAEASVSVTDNGVPLAVNQVDNVHSFTSDGDGGVVVISISSNNGDEDLTYTAVVVVGP